MTRCFFNLWMCYLPCITHLDKMEENMRILNGRRAELFLICIHFLFLVSKKVGLIIENEYAFRLYFHSPNESPSLHIYQLTKRSLSSSYNLFTLPPFLVPKAATKKPILSLSLSLSLSEQDQILSLDQGY